MTTRIPPEVSEPPRSDTRTGSQTAASANSDRQQQPRLKGVVLPARPNGQCARCHAARGSKVTGWHRVVTSTGEPVGWTCTDCPKQNEPIRRVETSKGDVRWRYTVTATPEGTHRAIQKTGTASTLEEAREQVAAIREEILRTGTYAKPTRLTVAELTERWLAVKAKDVAAGNMRQVTLVASYRSSLRTVCLHIGQREVEHLTPADLRDLLNVLKTKGGLRGKPLGKGSLTMALLSMRLILDWAVEQKWIEASPATGVKVPKVAQAPSRVEKDQTPKMWTEEEYDRFQDHVDEAYATGTQQASRDPWVRAGMHLTLCGLRRSEVLGLGWESVDFDAGTVEIVAARVNTGEGSKTVLGEPKSDESWRTVEVEDICPGTRAALRELWIAQGQPSEGLVVLDNLGRPVAPDTFSHRFWALSESAGVSRISIHNTRHTLAAIMHAAGVPPQEAASVLGHSTATHIAFYLPVSDRAGRQGAQTLRARREARRA